MSRKNRTIRRGSPHKDPMDAEINRLEKLGGMVASDPDKWHKRHKQASDMWKKHMRQKVKR